MKNRKSLMKNHKYNNTKYNNTIGSDKEESVTGGPIIIEDPISLSISYHQKSFKPFKINYTYWFILFELFTSEIQALTMGA